RFRREVDFCSGVFLLLRRAAFGAVGGFDEAFAPAYSEDVDLCVRLREAGYRTLYEPDAVLRHYEFGSSAERAVALQQLARPRFVAKHEAWLARRPQPDLRNLLRGRTAERRGRQRILLVDDAVPHGWLGGGLPRARHLALALAARGRFLTLYTTAGAEPDWPAVRETLGAEVEVIAGSRAALPSFLADRQGCYDTIVVSRPHNMQAFNRHAEADPAGLRRVRLVYDAEAVFAVRGIRAARLAGRPLAAEAAEAAIAEEILLAARADQVLVVSEEEAEHFRARVPAPVSVLAHAIAPRPGAAAFAQRRGLLFVGPLSEEGSPNVDAVTWFVTEILPLIRARIGAVELRIAGRVTVPRIERLAGDGVHLLGTVQDLTALYEASRLLVAPARFAAGVPAKVIEAGAHGLPAVATGLLAHQLGWIPGTELLAAADAASFADACIELHEDPVTWDNLRQAALARVAADYAPEDFAAGVERILER
ncbi:MAG: glycosyltransferase, partial [Dongiaceae bacterium]